MRLGKALALANDAYSLTSDDRHEVIERSNCRAMFYPKFEQRPYDFAVSIAGTNDIEDLLQAAQFCGRRNRHLGFYTHSLPIKKAIEKRIPTKIDTLFLVGHSLGGVAAQFISLDMAPYCRSINVTSFGAPKGFRQPFRLPENVSWLVIDNDLDMVPEYPLLKKFDRARMVELNQSRYLTALLWNTQGTKLGYYRKIGRILSESMPSLSPITNTYETIRKYHSLDNYSRLWGKGNG